MTSSFKLTCALFALLIAFTAQAQTNSVSIGTSSTNPSAVLWLNSPNGNQGLIIPVGSRANVVSPAKGMLIFDTNQVYVYDGTNWNPVSGGGNGLPTPGANQILTSNGSSVPTWVGSIPGSQVTPAFGAQAISTTGTLSSGATTVTGLTVSGATTSLNNKTYTWPNNPTLTAGSVLQTDASGNLTWSPAGGSSYSAGTGLTLSSNTFSVNPSQSISTLSNLVNNGLIKTSGGTGLLSIATAGTDYVATESDPTVKAINGIVKSNGTTIGAVVSGTDIKTINSTSLLGGGNINLVATETDPTVKAINGLVKSNGTTISAAVAGTDYVATETDATVKAINGIVKSNGTTISAAVSGTDYLTPFGSQTAKFVYAAPNAAAGTPSFRALVASDIPTLNQNTTGSSGSVANALTVDNTSLQLSSGTTYNGSAALTISVKKISEALGGTNQTTYAAGDILYASAANTLSKLAIGTPNQVLTINAGGTAPFWAPASSGWSLTGNSGTVDGTNFIGTTDAIPLNFKVNGLNAGRLDATLSNTFYGIKSGNVTTGGSDVAVGSQALQLNTSGSWNTAVGTTALINNSTGVENTGIGGGALGNNTAGSYNTAVGLNAMYFKGAGDNNTAIGYYADIATGSTNATAIGNHAYAGASNSLVLGSINGVNGATTSTKVGIGTATPISVLDVSGDLHLAQITAPSPVTDKLYNVGGSLFWNGTNISSGGTGWGLSGNSLSGTEFIGSTNAQDLIFKTNSIERARLNSSGNFGIGTNIPGTILHAVWNAASNINPIAIIETTGAGSAAALRFRNSSSQSYGMGILGNGDFAVSSQGNNVSVADIIRITSTNNVGIGATSPVSKLDVNGDLHLAQVTAPATTADKLYNVAGSLFWNGTNISSGGGSGWALTGNTGTADATNFIGTSDLKPFNIRVNNTSSGRIDPTLLNTFFGYQSGSISTTGANNTGMGFLSLNANIGGDDNVAIGYGSMKSNKDGGGNVAIGRGSLFSIGLANSGASYGTYNTAVGYQALYQTNPSATTNGYHNTAVGFNAGQANTTGISNTFLGDAADASVGNLSNATAIGANAVVATSNSLVLGATGANAVKVGIGTTSPGATLDVQGGDINTSGEINRTSTGSANMVPIAYGAIDQNGTILSGSGNFSVVSFSGGGSGSTYNIAITGEAYSSSGYITNVTTNVASGGCTNFPPLANTFPSGSNLGVFVFAMGGGGGSTTSPCGAWSGISFVVYKP